MVLTPEKRAALEAQLEQARVAEFKLETGSLRASVSYEGEQVTFSAANRASLRAFIRRLEAQLGQRASGRARSRGVTFG
ncbi:gpW family head-tail joining protein [Nitratireductor pacificus]|uniref:Head-to-tail joining protein W gpW family protein n=1 Tax=Nitratireductor pacificus pht-3B TaxID=391937 RepID=K2LH29_9HYPH|nr:gpW family head-tail joining protein [Nitratireductor pacificus]EKF17074.1 Head-to-tail joining protein W gpW family protein [Nitratireductor pacificus pht-3B]